MITGVLTLFLAEVILKSDVLSKFQKEEVIKRVQRPQITELLLTPNPYSRPQKKLSKVNAVVIHYVAKPGSTAKENRNYFEGLKDTHETYASSNFIVGLEGEIIQCVPLDEVAYCSNERNDDSISIECCHFKKSGKFNQKTYRSLVQLTAWLCGKYQLTAENIIRHYDITGKNCPKYYVEHEKEWEKFKLDVEQYIYQNGIE